MPTWLDMDAVERLIQQRYINRVHHPTLPIYLLNYSDHATWEQMWTPETIACRGLVLADDGATVARPMDKFFNLGQAPGPGMADLPPGPMEVTDKMDGSLIIAYRWDGRLHACTRGSFVSDQARWATELLEDLDGGWDAFDTWTFCFEFISGRRNRVVVNYGDADGLVLIAARDIQTAAAAPHATLEYFAGRLGVPVVPLREMSMQILAAEAERATGIEGWVLHWPTEGVRVKIKTSEYIALHRLISGLSPGRVRDTLMEHGSVDTLAMALPDEFAHEVRTIGGALEAHVASETARLAAVHADLLAEVGPVTDAAGRKAYALAARSRRPADIPRLFRLLDGKDLRWSLLKDADVTGFDAIGTSISRARALLEA